MTSYINSDSACRTILPAKFHPDPIWNDEALNFSEQRHRNKKKNKKKNKMSSDMRISSW